MIVIVGCNKGGAGKSTTATNIAVGLAMRGDDVCLMDADPQRSAARWHKDREEADIEWWKNWRTCQALYNRYGVSLTTSSLMLLAVTPEN